jgi:hypothetical protein
LDHAGWEIPASSDGRLAGFASRQMKLFRHSVGDGAVRTHLIVVSTPSLAFSPCLVEAEEPVGIQALRPEFAVQGLDEDVLPPEKWSSVRYGF